MPTHGPMRISIAHLITCLSRVVKSYLEGLSWVLHYYYQGVSKCDLSWSYPGCVLIRLLKYIDPLMAMVLSLPLCSFRRGLRRHRTAQDRVQGRQAFQAVRATYGCFPCCIVSLCRVTNSHHIRVKRGLTISDELRLSS